MKDAGYVQLGWRDWRLPGSLVSSVCWTTCANWAVTSPSNAMNLGHKTLWKRLKYASKWERLTATGEITGLHEFLKMNWPSVSFKCWLGTSLPWLEIRHSNASLTWGFYCWCECISEYINTHGLTHLWLWFMNILGLKFQPFDFPTTTNQAVLKHQQWCQTDSLKSSIYTSYEKKN